MQNQSDCEITFDTQLKTTLYTVLTFSKRTSWGLAQTVRLREVSSQINVLFQTRVRVFGYVTRMLLPQVVICCHIQHPHFRF